jgi:L-2-hydroxyglutarate oxidase LhgO
MADSRYNIIVIGGGAVGLGVALEITRRFPRQRLLVLEKEDGVARHQSGHNSGVIHSGVYYKPGSLKARLCVAGAAAMVEFCREHGIPHQVCGKVIVATHEEEIPRLEELRQRGEANGLTGLRVIGAEELREIEPHAAGRKALLVPSTGVTDYALVCAKYAEMIATNGAVLTSAAATGIKRDASEIVVETTRGAFATDALINCAGLYSDRISRMAGDDPGVMIVPFRGEYYDLVPERAALVHHGECGRRTECGAGSGSRRIPSPRHQRARSGLLPGICRILAHGAPALAQRFGGMAPVAVEGGIRERFATAATGNWRERFGPRGLGRAGAGTQARRRAGR